MKRLLLKTLFLFSVSMAASITALAEPAVMIKADKLYEKPFADAKVVITLKIKQQVEIIGRNGAWYQVNVSGKKGWVRMLSARRTATASVASAGSLSSVASGRAGTGAIVATTGVRGLNEENLAQATYDEKAITKAESFRVTADAASRFAVAGKLRTRSVPELPAPDKGGK